MKDQLLNKPLKYTRDYEANCREVYNDWLWFWWRAIPATAAITLGVLALLLVVVHHAEAIDQFFTNLMPRP